MTAKIKSPMTMDIGRIAKVGQLKEFSQEIHDRLFKIKLACEEGAKAGKTKQFQNLLYNMDAIGDYIASIRRLHAEWRKLSKEIK